MADYFVEGGDVLENKLGITDPEQLHERLFGKVYPFAGQIRTVNITKQDSSIPFCYADFIEPEANRIFQDLEVKNYLKMSKTYPDGAYMYGDIDWKKFYLLHPERKGFDLRIE